MRRVLTVLVILTAAAIGLLPASAGVQHDRTVSADPVDWTPHVSDGTVYAMLALGDRVYVGGDFDTITDSDGTEYPGWDNLFAYHRSTGEIDQNFRPMLDGTVRALAPGEDGTLYVGGGFDEVDSSSQPGLARLATSSGRQYGDGDLGTDGGEVRSLQRHGDALYVGGRFTSISGVERPALARFDTTTDRLDRDFDMEIAEPKSGSLRVEQLAISPGGTRLVLDGTFTEVAGQSRYLIAMVDVAANPAQLTSWSTDVFSEPCASHFDTPLRGLDFAPDGSYFVLATSGGTTGTSEYCDSAIRFETDDGSGAEPTWVNRTGGDSLYAVAATGPAVYVGGHQRWLNNPDGNDRAGPGAVSRPGIGALHP
ncbi:MAG: PKD domain containing protein, partial [Micromonosporaceae bacterium]